MDDDRSTGLLPGDDDERAAALHTEPHRGPQPELPKTAAGYARSLSDGLPQLLAESPPFVLERTVLAVAAMHDVDGDGRCRVCAECQPRRWRWWRRRRPEPCPTRRVMCTELYADTGPRFTAA